MFDLLITGGTVVMPTEAAAVDVGVQDGRIVAIGAPGTLVDEAVHTIDATGRIVTPGGIEPHIHAAANVQPGVHQQVEGVPNAGPLDHSLGAIWGGTTTVVDFAPAPNEGELVGGILDFLSVWEGNTYADYSAHVIYRTSNTADSIARVGELINNDFPSVKIFTTNIRPPSDPPLSLTPTGRIDNGRLADLTAQLARHDGVLAVHAEDDEIVMYNYLLAQQRGMWDWYNAHLIHSKEVEDVAFRDVIRIAEQNGAGMYFVHVTGSDGVNAVAAARSRGQAVYGEVLTLALSFNAFQYREPDGMKYPHLPVSQVSRGWQRPVVRLAGQQPDLHRHRQQFHHLPGQDGRPQRAGHARRQHRHRDPHGRQLHRGRGSAGHASDPVRQHHRHQRCTPARECTRKRASSPPAATPTLRSSTPPSTSGSPWTTCTCVTTVRGKAGKSSGGRQR